MKVSARESSGPIHFDCFYEREQFPEDITEKDIELNDMAVTLTKIKALKPDMLVVSGHEKGALTAVSQIKAINVFCKAVTALAIAPYLLSPKRHSGDRSTALEGKPESSLFKGLWMPDQVRHDGPTDFMDRH